MDLVQIKKKSNKEVQKWKIKKYKLQQYGTCTNKVVTTVEK